MGIIISEDDWIERFKPLPAPGSESGYDYGNGCTLIDGHSQADRDLLEAADDRCIWTVLDSGESTAIAPGLHFVNRMGHIITQEPWTDDIDEVEVEDMTDDFDEDEESDD